MFGGVGVALSALPEELVARHGLGRRVHGRGGEKEVRFLFRESDRVLPAWLGGRLQILRWGNRRGQSRALPCTGWVWRSSLEAGRLAEWRAEPVVIPASIAVDRGVWYQVREGVRGVAVRDEQGRPVVYVLVEPSTHYYEVMTRSPWMPVLVGQLI